MLKPRQCSESQDAEIHARQFQFRKEIATLLTVYGWGDRLQPRSTVIKSPENSSETIAPSAFQRISVEFIERNGYDQNVHPTGTAPKSDTTWSFQNQVAG